MIEIVLIISSLATIYVMDMGIGIIMANYLCSKDGYSLAVCGYMQTSPPLRLGFTDQLSLNSTCRKILQRAAYIFILLEALTVISPIGATGVVGKPVRVVQNPVNCISFISTSPLRDRKWPTISSTNGVAELIFGNALGCMRSEHG